MIVISFRYLFRSGNTEHPSDRFYNTTVEILPMSVPENSEIWNAYNSTMDGFLIVGAFNEFGIAEGIIEAKIGKIKEIRLHAHTDSENWAILSEVYIHVYMYTKKPENVSASLSPPHLHTFLCENF